MKLVYFDCSGCCTFYFCGSLVVYLLYGHLLKAFRDDDEGGEVGFDFLFEHTLNGMEGY